MNKSSEEVSAPISYKDRWFNKGTYVTNLVNLDASSHSLQKLQKVQTLDWTDIFLVSHIFD